MVCVIDISYSDIGMGRAELRQSSAIGRSLIVEAAMSRSRTKHPHDMDVSYQRLTTIRVALDVCADFAISLALRRRFWNGIGLAVLLTQYPQPLNGHVEIERRSHGRFTALCCRRAGVRVVHDAYRR